MIPKHLLTAMLPTSYLVRASKPGNQASSGIWTQHTETKKNRSSQWATPRDLVILEKMSKEPVYCVLGLVKYGIPKFHMGTHN